MNTALECIEPLLCFAHARTGAADWPLVHGAVRACTAYAELHRSPEPAEYDAQALLQRAVAGAGRPAEVGHGSVAALTGDGEQIVVLIRTFLCSAILEHDAVLCADIVEIDDVPAVRLSIDGPGRFPDPLRLGIDLALPYSSAEAIWTSATRGGRIDAQPGQLDLRMKGIRALHEVPVGCEAVAGPLRDAERNARMLASGEFAVADTESLRGCLEQILDDFDAQDDPPKPCDVGTLVRDYFAGVQVEGDPVHTELSVAPDLPPVSVRRNRITRLCAALRALSRGALAHGGSMNLELDYDLPQRSLLINVTGQGRTDEAVAVLYVPTLERAVGAHGGEALADLGQAGFTLLISIPDAVARTMDEWLPGWDTFAPRSIQMLRLLKSGGPVPPEELILHGVLEDELERRLLPRLGVAPAATLIHDLRPRTPALSDASAPRIEKVQSQLKRGKPKKEICAPVYAAEIFWMFSCDDRHASAVGLASADSAEVLGFCKALADSPIDYLRALTLLARMLRPVEAE